MMWGEQNSQPIKLQTLSRLETPRPGRVVSVGESRQPFSLLSDRSVVTNRLGGIYLVSLAARRAQE